MTRKPWGSRQLTLGFLNFPDLHPADLVAVAGEAGFGSVGVRITGRRPADPYPPVLADKVAIAEILRRADDAGLRISNISSYHLYPDIDLDTLKPVLETSAALGASSLVAARYDSDAARFHDFLAAFAELAGTYGIRLAYEFVPFSKAPALADAREALRLVSATNFGLMLDPLHLARSGGDPADLADLDPGRIFIVQICDASAQKRPDLELPEEARTARVFPGEGGLPLGRFLDAMPDTAEIELEMPHAGYAHLPHVERARLMRAVSQAYFAGFDAARQPER